MPHELPAPPPSLLRYVAAAAAFGVGVSLVTTPYMGAATAAYLLMVFGVLFRRGTRERHRQLMFVAMGIDLSLVLALEVLRGAVATAVGVKLGPWQMAHVLASTVAVALYLPTIFLGMRVWETETPGRRNLHRRLGMLTFFFRSVGFVLMFSLLWKSA